MLTTKLAAGVLSVAIALVLATPDTSAGIASQNKPCQRLYSDWKKKSGHKAFSVTPSTGVGMQACGAVWGASSKAVAEKEAIKACRRNKVLTATCYIMESK